VLDLSGNASIGLDKGRVRRHTLRDRETSSMVQTPKVSADTASVVRAVVPMMPYRNPMPMIEWLADAYGFERRRLVRSASGELRYAQLDFGDGTIMVVPAQDRTFERLIVHPDQIGGVETQTCYLVVPDIDGHYAKATSSGAEIVSDIVVDERGGRSYASRDPEGHIWRFGTYDPRENRSLDTNEKRRRNLRLGVPLLTLALLALAASVSVAVWHFTHMMSKIEADVLRFATQQRAARQGVERDAKNLADELVQAEMAKATAERDVAGLAAQLSKARASLEIALAKEKEARGLLAKETRANEALTRMAKQTADQLGQARLAREAAEKAAKDATDQLSRVRFANTTEPVPKGRSEACEPERRSRLLAERSAQDALAELARERSARAAAEIAATELRDQLTALGTGHQGVLALRNEFEAERRAKEGFERAAKDAQLLLAQERYSRDATERALKQAQERLASTSCWACPTGAPCSRP
jgi:uncharacterized glyoxalase superfamily protein PhnB